MNKDRHHLVPRHRGGTDADGLVEVSKTRHAMFHFCEWQLHKHREDFIAWKALSGQLQAGEISEEKEALRVANMKGKKRSPETRRKISEARKSLKGKIKNKGWSEEAKLRHKDVMRKRFHGDKTDEEIITARREMWKAKSRRLRARKGHT